MLTRACNLTQQPVTQHKTDKQLMALAIDFLMVVLT